MYFKQIKDYVKSNYKNDTKNFGQGNKKCHFQSWLETNSSGIGIASG